MYKRQQNTEKATDGIKNGLHLVHLRSPRFLYADLFCGCETCFLDLSEGNRLRVFQHQSGGRMFGPRRGYPIEG